MFQHPIIGIEPIMKKKDSFALKIIFVNRPQVKNKNDSIQ